MTMIHSTARFIGLFSAAFVLAQLHSVEPRWIHLSSAKGPLAGRNVKPSVSMRQHAFWVPLIVAWALMAGAHAGEPGTFFKSYWYDRSADYNPHYERRFRINAPETVLHPQFGQRVEARENGLMLIRAEENLAWITGARLYLELWGGHPGTANKRVTLNGRTSHALPEVGTATKNCTYHYPLVNLKITDLVNGYNAVQFACDQGDTFWGHYLIDNAALVLSLTNRHPELVQAGLGDFEARLDARSTADEKIDLALDIPERLAQGIARVEFQGFYEGFDENGDGITRDWHGFTKGRKPESFIAVAEKPPFRASWDLSLMPEQADMAVRAFVVFRAPTNLMYLTAPLKGLSTPQRGGTRVTVEGSKNLPRPFWSRAGQKKSCSIELNVAPNQVQRAELHIVTWTGGPGNVKQYFTLNGRHFPVAEGTKHEVQYSRFPVEPAWLRKGENHIELLSDTDHHGIEVFLPGPALVVRYRN